MRQPYPANSGKAQITEIADVTDFIKVRESLIRVDDLETGFTKAVAIV